MERRSLKRLSLPLLKTCVKSGPFAPRALPRFLATMSRSDSRPRPPRGYGFPRGVAPTRRTTPGLPGPSLLLSTRALPTHPGQPDACMRSLLPHQLQASSSSADWPLPLVSRGRIGFAYAGLASWLSQLVSHSPGLRRTDPFRTAGYPSVPGRSYMVNEQFTWLTPRSQRERAGLPWRNRRHDEKLASLFDGLSPLVAPRLARRPQRAKPGDSGRVLTSCPSYRRPVVPARSASVSRAQRDSESCPYLLSTFFNSASIAFISPSRSSSRRRDSAPTF